MYSTTHYAVICIGIPWVIWFALPIVGYTGIFVAHFLPHYLPGVYRSDQLLHHVRYDTQQNRTVLLYGIVEQLQHKYLTEIHSESLLSGIRLLSRCLTDSSSDRISLADIYTLADIIQYYVEWSDLQRDHLRWLLTYIGNNSALNGVYPKCYIEYKLNIISNDILVDDNAIRHDTIQSLTDDEIITAAYYRGLPFDTNTYTIQQITEYLRQWLQLTGEFQINTQRSITLPATECTFLSKQSYTNNQLLPITLLHLGMLWHSIDEPSHVYAVTDTPTQHYEDQPQT